MNRKGFISFLLSLVAAVLLGCSSDTDSTGENQIKIGFAIKTQDNPYFVVLVDTLKEAANQEGWKFTVLNANGDITREAENLESLIAQRMDLIFLDSVEPDACIPSINAAAEAGIGVINLDSGVGEGAKDVTTVYSDNKQNGRLVGLAYARKMGDRFIQSIILSGAKGNVAGKERRTGLFCGIIEGKTGMTEDEAWAAALVFDDQLISNGKATLASAQFTVAGQGWGAWTREKGLEAAEDLITANPGLTTVLGENDQMLFGALRALENAGINHVDMVAAADGAKEAYDLIRVGKYFGTGENSPYKIAARGMEVAKEILLEEKDMWSYPDITLTQPVAVTIENVEEYYEYGF